MRETNEGLTAVERREKMKLKKAISVQAGKRPDCSKRLRFSNFKTIST
jgi:hypothetical protein